MFRRRLVPLLAVLLGALAFAATTAWAGFPNFRKFQEPVLVDGGSTSDTAGLAAAAGTDAAFGDPRVFVDGIVIVGVREGVESTLTAQYEAVYVCVNGGDNVPSAANKTTLVGQLQASATFPAANNGKVEGSLLTEPLPSPAEVAATSGFACPSGQELEFDRVIFSGLVLSIEGGEVVQLDTTLASGSVHGIS